MINSFRKPLAVKVLYTFFIFHCFLQSTLQAQTNHLKPTASKSQPKPQSQVQAVSEPPNPFAEIDKKALLIPDSLTRSTEAIASYINANFRI